MSVYPRCRHFDMICGDKPTWTLRPDETVNNSSRARVDKLLEKTKKKFGGSNKMPNFLSNKFQAYSNKTPMELAEESVNGFQIAMRLLKHYP